MQIYLREDGRDRTNRLSTFHPEIAKPADRLPTAQGCMAALPSAAQVVFTNAAVSAMLAAFYAWRRGKLDYEEDLPGHRARPDASRAASGPGRARIPSLSQTRFLKTSIFQ